MLELFIAALAAVGIGVALHAKKAPPAEPPAPAPPSDAPPPRQPTPRPPMVEESSESVPEDGSLPEDDDFVEENQGFPSEDDVDWGDGGGGTSGGGGGGGPSASASSEAAAEASATVLNTVAPPAQPAAPTGPSPPIAQLPQFMRAGGGGPALPTGGAPRPAGGAPLATQALPMTRATTPPPSGRAPAGSPATRSLPTTTSLTRTSRGPATSTSVPTTTATRLVTRLRGSEGNGSLVARGGVLPEGRVRSNLKSEIPGVSDEAWTEFAVAMRTQARDAVSDSNGLGMWEMKPRRLADLGIMRQVSCERAPTGRMVWCGDFVPPLTKEAFLRDPRVQYGAFSDSMRDYAKRLCAGKISRPDAGGKGMSLSGALAVLHRAGPEGLKGWGGSGKRFPDTEAAYERAAGIF